MLVRPADENQTALSLSELRNIQKKTNARDNAGKIPAN